MIFFTHFDYSLYLFRNFSLKTGLFHRSLLLREESPGNAEQFAIWKNGYVFRNKNITDSVTESQVALSNQGHSENVR